MTIIVGFTIVLVVQGILMVISVVSAVEHDKRLRELQAGEEKMQLVFTMRDATRNRVIRLYQFATTEDPFERDEQFMLFRQEGEKFLMARSKLVPNISLKEEIAAWEKTKPLATKGGIAQHQAIELFTDGKIDQGFKLMSERVIPVQQQVKAGLQKMIDAQRNVVNNEVAVAKSTNKIAFIFIVIGLGIAALVAMYVIIHTRRNEKEILSQSDRIRALHEVSSQHASIGEQIEAMLKLGLREFGLETAEIIKINKAEITHTTLYAIPKNHLTDPIGVAVHIEDPFFEQAQDQSNPLMIEQAVKVPKSDGFHDGKARKCARIAASIWLHGKFFGIIHFSQSKPRKTTFTKSDKDLMQLMARWVSVNLEEQLSKQQLEIEKENAEKANRAKTDFLANMSHEIRTPLTAVIGFSEALLDPNHKEGDGDKQNTIEAIIRNSKHLQQVINDILDLTKIEAGQLELERIQTSPFQILAELESTIGMRARDKGLDFKIKYELPLPKVINTDPVRLKQMLINLAGNAIKFTHEGDITIIISSNLESQTICFKVIDSGIGMTEEEMSRIFKAFSQADSSTTRKYGGTGLGLSICSQLAELLGGELLCTSEIGMGSQFMFSVGIGETNDKSLVDNLEKELALNKHFTLSSAVTLLKGKVLLAEDSEDNQRLISMHIRKTGAEIHIVKDGKQAVRHGLAGGYDLILMDMQMPIMDGVQAITLLRRAGYSGPIVALTANAMKSDRDACIDVGADDYLTKPIDLERFYKVLNTHLETTNQVSLGGHLTSGIAEDPEFQALIGQFLENIPEMLQEIFDAIAGSDWGHARTVFHKLKGLGGGFGYPEITKVAGSINNFIKEDNFEHAQTEFYEMVDLCQKIYNQSNLPPFTIKDKIRDNH